MEFHAPNCWSSLMAKFMMDFKKMLLPVFVGVFLVVAEPTSCSILPGSSWDASFTVLSTGFQGMYQYVW